MASKLSSLMVSGSRSRRCTLWVLRMMMLVRMAQRHRNSVKMMELHQYGMKSFPTPLSWFSSIFFNSLLKMYSVANLMVMRMVEATISTQIAIKATYWSLYLLPE